jgi:hypothetical protein
MEELLPLQDRQENQNDERMTVAEIVPAKIVVVHHIEIVVGLFLAVDVTVVDPVKLCSNPAGLADSEDM